jgi:hypothetical protein
VEVSQFSTLFHCIPSKNLKNQRHDDLTIEKLIYQAKLQLKNKGKNNINTLA